MGILPLSRHDPAPDVTFSHCFEQECTHQIQTEAGKPRGPGRFYTIVETKIGGLDVIMSAEVDCAMGMHHGQSIADINGSLTPTL